MENEEVEKELREIWDQPSLKHSEEQKENSWKQFKTQNFAHKKRVKWKIYAVAASFLLIIALTTGKVFQQSNLFNNYPISKININNPTKGIKRIVLPDSSKVELAALASLSYAENFTENRELHLEGEAVFDVQKDKKHPFKVHNQHTTTTVLGTIFRISTPSGASTKVELFEGSVQMQVKGYTENWLIAPGEAFLLENEKVSINDFNRFKEFHETPLSEFTAYIQQTYGYHLVFPKELREKKITLRLNKYEKIEHIIEILEKLYQLENHHIKSQEIYFTTKNL